MPCYLLHDVLPVRSSIMVRPPTMAVPSRSLRGSLFRACRLSWVPRLLVGEESNLTMSVAETLGGPSSAKTQSRESLRVHTRRRARTGYGTTVWLRARRARGTRQSAHIVRFRTNGGRLLCGPQSDPCTKRARLEGSTHEASSSHRQTLQRYGYIPCYGF
jgi:hypothetical protein